MTGPDLLWYVAYGSNLCEERFACYLAGGRPPGARRTYGGARDRSAPRGRRPVRLDQALWFGGESRVWGGGSALLGHRATPRDEDRAYGRAYLITVDQFEDVVAQENGGRAGQLELAMLLERADTGRPIRVPTAHRYDTLVALGTLEQRPLITVTTALPDVSPDHANPPSTAYRGLVATGLRQSWSLADAVIERYLDRAAARSAPGR